MRPSFTGCSAVDAQVSARSCLCLNFQGNEPNAVTPPSPFNPRRLALGAAKKLIFENEDPETALERIAGLTSMDNPTSSPGSNSMSRSRTTILNNLDEMY